MEKHGHLGSGDLMWFNYTNVYEVPTPDGAYSNEYSTHHPELVEDRDLTDRENIYLGPQIQLSSMSTVTIATVVRVAVDYLTGT